MLNLTKNGFIIKVSCIYVRLLRLGNLGNGKSVVGAVVAFTIELFSSPLQYPNTDPVEPVEINEINKFIKLRPNFSGKKTLTV